MKPVRGTVLYIGGAPRGAKPSAGCGFVVIEMPIDDARRAPLYKVVDLVEAVADGEVAP
jgi:hypothetical protein